MEEDIAPTDSRLRPDQRLMEEGRLHCQIFIKMKMQAQFQMGRGEQGEGATGGEAEGSEKAEGARGGTCCPGSYLCSFFAQFFLDKIVHFIRRGGILTQLSLIGSNLYRILTMGAK